MIFSSLLISSSSPPLPMYSVTFLVLRSPPAPPSEPPSPPSEPPSPPTPPEPPDPPDPQIRPSSGEIYAQVLLLPHFTGLPRVHSEHKLPSPPPSRHVPPIITVFVPRRSSRRCCHMPITTRSPKVKLRFSLVGPYHCCGLVTSLSRPNYRSCCGPTPLFDWTSFVSTPLHWLRDYQFRVQAPSIVPTAFFPSVHPLVVVICYLTFAVNSWDWLGFVQPCVSSSDMYVAFPCAPNVVGTSWAGFVISGMCTRILSGSLFNGQSRPSWALSIYMTSEVQDRDGALASFGFVCRTRLHGREHLCHKVSTFSATITEDRSVLELLGCRMVTIHGLLRVGLEFQRPTQRKDPPWIFFKTLCVLCSRSGGTSSQGGYQGGYQGGFIIGCIKAGLCFGLSGACSPAQYRWPCKRTR
ncbi:uncharacterized protein LOC9309734 isoform X2 [Arabidopsis lyrata subsp. lyrata]|uniref:uncharacterized protein LOC9309734 isoform X2 n=1 Tax=Arabidopsis lyrata subsp. lyrata TaxID=81972 RepID=UPI000A29DEE5|nr:uncharacterized protein LOC9309734 isoform X2 [Arabidopsis lyrata subsp. lyrata]|eukprot:XP_020879035.1 uncharacterized protein LOC9309734 isoform X2 [Arabidopsis lyrata subsp. lyrata]